MTNQNVEKSSSIFAHQPAKGLYTIWFIAFTLARVPIWFAYYRPQKNRPHPDYSCQTAVHTAFTSSYFSFLTTIRTKIPISLEPGKAGDRFVKLEPEADVSKAIYSDVCLRNPLVKPAIIGALWFPSPATKSNIAQGRKVILHFHAGAYVLMTASDEEYGTPIRTMAERFDSLVLCPNYRHATLPDGQGRFPAQLQDGITAYRYLLGTLKVNPSSIIFSGDSAGGHLVLMLLRYIKSVSSPDLPYPAGTMLWSPWVDLVRTPELLAAENRNKHMDCLPDELLEWGIREFTGNAVDLKDPYISPLQSPLAMPIPIWALRSPTERLGNSILKWVEESRRLGNKISLFEAKGSGHDVLAAMEFAGTRKVYEDALDDARKFLSSE